MGTQCSQGSRLATQQAEPAMHQVPTQSLRTSIVPGKLFQAMLRKAVALNTNASELSVSRSPQLHKTN
ncbi:MAG TPA: hypothetical protein DDX19_12900 [Rhodopirellula baltica]|nr:hypothetical protein [Rhodopirellula baltica]